MELKKLVISKITLFYIFVESWEEFVLEVNVGSKSILCIFVCKFKRLDRIVVLVV